ncbi:Cyclic peptide transporter [Nitrospira sp. KM1]|uniref:cyclic peptide export ABC transporter n=1 Tax=Nitrospira sp. KM1 TaxID=1936990 RepID=UPI0013A7ACA4|nr:cyclic peptide export ABC transporter [Nitrospira sp. KM1]BCA53916.1 Cyclic peptide transporter [Nitrospira sp. KM1]
MTLIRFLLRKSWKLVVGSLIAGLVSGLAGAALIAVIHKGMSESASTMTLAWGFLGLAVLVAGTKALSEILLTRLGQSTISELRLQLSRNILNAPLRQVEELGSHRLLAALSDDTDVIAQAYVQLPLICINAATTLGCLAYLGWLSWPVLLLVVGFMTFGALSFQWQEQRAVRLFERSRETNDALFRHFRSIVSGIKELKLHRTRREVFLTTQLSETVRAYERDFVGGMTVYSFASSWGVFLFYAVIGIVLFLWPVWRQTPAETITGAALVLLYMMGPFSQIVELLPGVGRANVAMRKVDALGLSLTASDATDAAAQKKPQAVQPIRPLWRHLELIGITHRYYHEPGDAHFQIGPIDLSFRPGEVTFLIGGNGSGKTTLAMVLLGLYPPESGVIRFDGMTIDESNREDYRQIFSTVLSDYFLFESLIGLERETLDGEATTYLERLQLRSKVRIEGGTFSTQALSQGQRKRLALLTAYVEDRPFYLFDEWASDQDPVFRKVFYTEILPDLRARGKAVLVITHDDQYFALADRCIRMDFGKIVGMSDGSMGTADSAFTHMESSPADLELFK